MHHRRYSSLPTMLWLYASKGVWVCVRMRVKNNRTKNISERSCDISSAMHATNSPPPWKRKDLPPCAHWLPSLPDRFHSPLPHWRSAPPVSLTDTAAATVSSQRQRALFERAAAGCCTYSRFQCRQWEARDAVAQRVTV